MKTRCRAPGCREPATYSRGLHAWCSVECGAVIAQAAAKKLRAKAEAEVKRVTRAKLQALKPRAKIIAEAQAAVNRYVRLRDAAQRCISCDKRDWEPGQWHAGHYRSTAAAPELRFDLDNLHKQCAQCNTYLSGNLIMYRAGLLERIGPERLAALEGPHPVRKWTREELIELRARFVAMAKEIE